MPHRSSQPIAQYEHPAQFEPLMPSEALLNRLQPLAHDLVVAATGLKDGALGVQRELKGLMRRMNSYYTNRIEGEHTRPADIDRALRRDFSGEPEQARKQRLALAHIETEIELERRVDAARAEGPDAALRWLYSSEALQQLHAALFGRLAESDRQLADGSLMQPGAFRSRQVAVGRHEPPPAPALALFLDRWAAVYGGQPRGEMAVIALAAAHHRLAWVHPFADGNGRVTRLHTHLLLHAMGLLNGLWSPLRGFARTEADYKRLLAEADQPRQGDFDGRGNLSERSLFNWIDYVLRTSLDQLQFMRGQLNLAGFRDRLRATLIHEQEVEKSGVRLEAERAIFFLASTGDALPRAEFKSLLPLGDRLGTAQISALLRRGFLLSDSPYGELRFGIPTHALRLYFPALWPEAEQDAAARD